jgi:translation initiation factor 1
MAKKLNNFSGLVFSTNPDYMQQQQPQSEEEQTLPEKQQKLRVQLETKQRGGKAATIINGFIGSNEDLEALGKKLKTKCGTGGSVKEGYILIQGDYKEKIIAWLKEWGYTNTK